MLCPLCERNCPSLESHHLQTRRKDRENTEEICTLCHKTIHGLFDVNLLRNPDLGLDTIEGLLEHEEFARAVKWIKKQDPNAKFKMKSSKDKKLRR